MVNSVPRKFDCTIPQALPLFLCRSCTLKCGLAQSTSSSELTVLPDPTSVMQDQVQTSMGAVFTEDSPTSSKGCPASARHQSYGAKKRRAHLFIQGHDVVGGLALLALAGSHEELVAHVQVQAVARVEPGGAPRAHYEALQGACAGAWLCQKRPAL